MRTSVGLIVLQNGTKTNFSMECPKKISLNDLSRIRKIISTVLNLLEDNISNLDGHGIDPEDSRKELLNFLMGSRESVVSTIGKLANLLIKIIDIEDKIGPSDQSDINERLSDEDLEILRKYIERSSFTADS